MKVGESLRLIMKDPETQEDLNLRCNIIGMGKNNLFIDYPINVNTSKTAYLQKDTLLIGIYVEEDKVPLHFPTRVIKRVSLNIPGLAIEYPEEEKIKRVQRREFVRIETRVDIAVHSLDNEFEPFTTVSHDLSGGGVSIVLPRNITLENDSKVSLWIVLPMSSQEVNYIRIEGIVIREAVIDEYNRRASIRFTSMLGQEQQKMVRFCFEKQRELRLQELEL